MDDDSSFIAAIESSKRLPLITAGRMPSPDSKVLFVLCAYRRQDLTRDVGWLTWSTLRILDGATAGRLRAHRVVHRDHYANPRSLAYLVGLVQRFRHQVNLRQVPDLLIDSGFNVEAQSCMGHFGNIELADLRGPQQTGMIRDAAGGHYDAVILMWADALGLGWESLERWTRRLPLVIAVNGRRRAFQIDDGTRRALGIRRYFAHTRLAEAAFALCAYPVAGFCALIDAVKRP